MSRIIGIDLGTTNSVVSALENGDPVVIPNREGSRTTPSIVGFSENGERFVGHQAKRQAVVNPKRTVSAVKRLLGHKYREHAIQDLLDTLPFDIVEATNGDTWVRIENEEYSAQEVSAQILSKMRSAAEDYFGEEISQAVITVPAYFDDAQRQATKAAGRIAGLDVRRIINEPTAAALAYGFSNSDDTTLAVFDLGGGTFDISLLSIRKGVFEVLSTCGDNVLGGEDFDRVILKYLIDLFQKQTDLDVTDDKMALQRLKEAAENAKCELSTISETNINLPFLAVGDEGPQHLNTTLSRSKVNELVQDLVDRLQKPCETALSDADVTPQDINQVLLVGGMTRMPLVREKVAEIFGVTPKRSVNPDEVVAIGAAIQSGILGGEVREIILLDITPLNLGIRAEGNRFSTVIEKNTSIPTRSAKTFTTTEDNQEYVQITVLQGDREVADLNKCLGTFTLTGIAPAERGKPRIEVAFDIDTDGIVHVTAEDAESKLSQSIIITNGHGLSTEEVERASSRVRENPVL